MQYKQHIRSYLFKKRLIQLIIKTNIFVKDWIVSKGQLQLEMQVHMLQSGDARGATRYIKQSMFPMKIEFESVPQKQQADADYLLEEMGKLLLKAENIHAKTLH
jgi:hypothetical protein